MPEQEVHEHIDPLGAYITVFIALMILLLLTVGAYLYDFGAHWGEKWGVLNTALALLIASVKAGLVMLVFMHLGGCRQRVYLALHHGRLLLRGLPQPQCHPRMESQSRLDRHRNQIRDGIVE
jgi:caa(3)-type oxidase subunit IV